MKILIEINCDNEAFTNAQCREISHILQDLAQFVECSDLPYDADPKPLYDSNGNKVGFLKIGRD